MNKYYIEVSYTTTSQASITLPKNKTWADVMDWFVKWDTLHVRFTGDEDYTEYELNSYASHENTDWKYPDKTAIYAHDKDGGPDYSKQLTED